MDVRHFRYALAVAEERSFTRAAERLYLSQPGLSRAIRDLEAEVGFAIFDRSGRQVELTPEGERAILHAEAAVAAFDEAVRDINGLTGRLSGPLRLGVSVDTWPYVADAVRRLAERHPELRLELRAGLDRMLSRLVDRRELDAAILWWPELDCEHEAQWLCDVPTILAVPAASPLDRQLSEMAGASARDLGEIADGEQLIMFERALAPATYDALLETMSPMGDIEIQTLSILDGGIESSQAAMLQAAERDGKATLSTPAHFARGASSLAGHRGVLPDVQLTMVHNLRAAALARAIVADLRASRPAPSDSVSEPPTGDAPDEDALKA